MDTQNFELSDDELSCDELNCEGLDAVGGGACSFMTLILAKLYPSTITNVWIQHGCPVN
jgi:hypothetical protein